MEKVKLMLVERKDIERWLSVQSSKSQKETRP